MINIGCSIAQWLKRKNTQAQLVYFQNNSNRMKNCEVLCCQFYMSETT